MNVHVAAVLRTSWRHLRAVFTGREFVACALLGAAAVVSFAIGDRVDRLMSTIRLPRPLSASIPKELGTWRGTDDDLAPEVVLTMKLTDHVRRRYVDRSGAEVVAYVAFHGNKERGLQTFYHHANVCFPSAGWTLESEKCSVETLHDAAREIPVCRYVFSKDGARLSVMTFFKVDDELLDQSPRNKPFWLLRERAVPKLDDSPGTFVQVQLITAVGPAGEHAAADVQSRFLRDFGRAILAAADVGVR